MGVSFRVAKRAARWPRPLERNTSRDGRRSMTDWTALMTMLTETMTSRHRPVIAVSGHAGAGKSTCARQIESRIHGCLRVRVDDFLVPSAVHTRSSDWYGVDRRRIRTDVLTPFKAGSTLAIRRLDWQTGQLGEACEIPDADVVCLEGIGIFHPELDHEFDLRIWVDCDPVSAIHRGMKRDRAAGLDHDRLWRHIWFANDHDFDHLFMPRTRADFIIDNSVADDQ